MTTKLHTIEEKLVGEFRREMNCGVGQGGFALGSLKEGESAELDFGRLERFLLYAFVAQREAIVEMAEGMKLSELGHPGRPFYGTAAAIGHAISHNAALTDLTTQLRDKGEDIKS